MPEFIDGGPAEPIQKTAEPRGWLRSKWVCHCLTWGFLAFAIVWATGIHELLIYLATEHYALTAGVVSFFTLLVTADKSDESKFASGVFVSALVVVVASALHGLVWGWGSILLYDEIYGARFLVPAVPGLAVEVGIAAVLACAIWNSRADYLRTTKDRIVMSLFAIPMLTGIVFAVAIGVSVLADAIRKSDEARQASQSLTQEQRAEIGRWRCVYNKDTGVATCANPKPTP